MARNQSRAKLVPFSPSSDDILAMQINPNSFALSLLRTLSKDDVQNVSDITNYLENKETTSYLVGGALVKSLYDLEARPRDIDILVTGPKRKVLALDKDLSDISTIPQRVLDYHDSKETRNLGCFPTPFDSEGREYLVEKVFGVICGYTGVEFSDEPLHRRYTVTRKDENGEGSVPVDLTLATLKEFNDAVRYGNPKFKGR